MEPSEDNSEVPILFFFTPHVTNEQLETLAELFTLRGWSRRSGDLVNPAVQSDFVTRLFCENRGTVLKEFPPDRFMII